MLIDTHAHLYHRQLAPDLPAALRRAAAAGVERVLLPATDLATAHEALALGDRHPGLYAMAGIHPTSVHEAAPGDAEAVRALLDDPRVVAVGETGLDYYWSREHVEAQQASLRAHARWAAETNKPLVIHNRDERDSDACARDIVAILREVREGHPHGARLRGVFHCFGGPPSLTAEVLDLGFHVGLGGTLTYKDGRALAAVAEVPLGKIILETDAPYLAPVPHRGARNEPAHVRLVAECLAAARGLAVEEIAAQTTANAEALFGLPAWPPPGA